jgi:hypothetical protein
MGSGFERGGVAADTNFPDELLHGWAQFAVIRNKLGVLKH